MPPREVLQSGSGENNDGSANSGNANSNADFGAPDLNPKISSDPGGPADLTDLQLDGLDRVDANSTAPSAGANEPTATPVDDMLAGVQIDRPDIEGLDVAGSNTMLESINVDGAANNATGNDEEPDPNNAPDPNNPPDPQNGNDPPASPDPPSEQESSSLESPASATECPVSAEGVMLANFGVDGVDAGGGGANIAAGENQEVSAMLGGFNGDDTGGGGQEQPDSEGTEEAAPNASTEGTSASKATDKPAGTEPEGEDSNEGFSLSPDDAARLTGGQPEQGADSESTTLLDSTYVPENTPENEEWTPDLTEQVVDSEGSGSSEPGTEPAENVGEDSSNDANETPSSDDADNNTGSDETSIGEPSASESGNSEEPSTSEEPEAPSVESEPIETPPPDSDD